MNHEAESTDAPTRVALLNSSGEPEELLVLMGGGSLLLGWHEPDDSRGSRPDLWEARGEIPRAYPAVKRRDKRSRHVWVREMSANDPLTKRRKDSDDSKTRVSPLSWEQHGRYLLTGHAGSGVQAA